MRKNILKIRIGANVQSILTLAQQAMEQLSIGEQPVPYFDEPESCPNLTTS